MDRPIVYTQEQIEAVLRELARCTISSIKVCFHNVSKSLCIPRLERGCIHNDIEKLDLLSELAGSFELDRLSTVLWWHYEKYMANLEQLLEKMEPNDDE